MDGCRLDCPPSQQSCGRGILDYPSSVRPSVKLENCQQYVSVARKMLPVARPWMEIPWYLPIHRQSQQVIYKTHLRCLWWNNSSMELLHHKHQRLGPCKQQAFLYLRSISRNFHSGPLHARLAIKFTTLNSHLQNPFLSICISQGSHSETGKNAKRVSLLYLFLYHTKKPKGAHFHYLKRTFLFSLVVLVIIFYWMYSRNKI